MENLASEDEAGDEEIVTVLTADDEFRFIGQDFRDAVDALRETHDELSPAASQLDHPQHVWTGTLRVSKRLTDEERMLMMPAFQGIPDSGLPPMDFVDRIWEAVKDTEWGPELTMELMKRVRRPRREPIFHNAILISVVSAFEAHLAKLAEQYYRAAPAALHDLPRESAKEFSLRELQDLDSIGDAIELAIEARVSRLMYGNLTDWKKFFAERMKIDLSELADSWSDIQEVFERRHCIVHSEARASRRYIGIVKGVEYYDALDADLDYVRKATDALELLGVSLHAIVWSKFALEKQEVIDALEQTAFQALKEGRWAFSLTLYERWQTLPLSEAEKRMAQVNLWIARKNIDGFEAVRDEITSWDVSGSDEIYQFAKLCLLDDLDGAFAMVSVLIERDKLDGKSLATWPLTEGLRRDPRIQDYDGVVRDYLRNEAEQDDFDEAREKSTWGELTVLNPEGDGRDGAGGQSTETSR